MCALRKDLIAIGGADMHIDYLGHICGPYDMTFRLINYARREIWENNEFLYHTWHPGQAGADNYMGPHDGRHMSTTSLEALSSGRVAPFLASPAILALRQGRSQDEALAVICPDHYRTDWNIESIKARGTHERWSNYKRPMGTYKGFRLVAEVDRVFAFPLTEKDAETRAGQGYTAPFEGYEVGEVRDRIDAITPRALNHLTRLGVGLTVLRRAVASAVWRAGKLPLPLPRMGKVVLVLPLAPLILLGLLITRPRRLFDKGKTALARIAVRDPEQWQLAAALHNLKRWGTIGQGGRLVLVVTSEGTRTYLNVLKRFSLIPRVSVEVAESPEQFDALLTRLDNDSRPVEYLMLPSAVHARFHAAVVGSNTGKHCLVL